MNKNDNIDNNSAGNSQQHNSENDSGESSEDIYEDSIGKSYVERVLYKYLQSYLIGGYNKLVEKEHKASFIYSMFLLFSSITTGTLYITTTAISLEIVQLNLIFTLFTTVGFLISALLGGYLSVKYDNGKIINYMELLLCILAWLSTWLYYEFSLSYDYLLFQSLKLAFFLIYIAISSISIFFIIISFHTSLAYRVISLGNSPNRLFFQPIIRLGAWIFLLTSIYLLMQGGTSALIIGGTGLIAASIIVFKVNNYKLLEKGSTFEEKDAHRAYINFRQVLGFYNLYLIYHTIQSFNSGGRISNIWTELVLLLINIFFIVNSLTKRAGQVKDIDEVEKAALKFRKENVVFMKFKKNIGERGLILFSLAIALGYIVILLDSFMSTPILLIDKIGDGTQSLSIILHRCLLIVGILLVLIAMVLFNLRPQFRELFKNKYTMEHALRIFKDAFVKKWEDTVKPIGDAITIGKQKIENWKNQFGERFLNKNNK